MEKNSNNETRQLATKLCDTMVQQFQKNKLSGLNLRNNDQWKVIALVGITGDNYNVRVLYGSGKQTEKNIKEKFVFTLSPKRFQMVTELTILGNDYTNLFVR